ncbi:4'-phosphopantetheinyl transferase family protein [Lachnoclostridium sp. Marseille-P6806]|uniref:4'-phosphopantetheinyl transferase family protein n=1 Tax=Lachnoclostridium sp. Marseille-P6806 TaxID=2364793 RepID=UPI001030AFAB|nr:4'-phosphopantetheinyl transferase superfamily protein [Lachnoclostridium sp. Marseille-P6806]
MLLYLCHVSSAFLSAPSEELISLLPAYRRERLRRIKNPADRARSLVGGLMLRRYAGILEDSDLRFSPQGKPSASRGSVFFSLSHSGSLVLAGVSSSCEIGVDIETPRALKKDIRRMICSAREQEWLRSRADCGSEADAFFSLWTAKEAVMKATGLGFSMGASSADVLPVENGIHRIPVPDARGIRTPELFSLFWLRAGNAFLAAAARGEDADCALHEMTETELFAELTPL